MENDVDLDLILPDSDNPNIKKILEDMDKLFLEIQIDGSDFKIPEEFEPQLKDVTVSEARDLIIQSFCVVHGQLVDLIDQLYKIDLFSRMRLEQFFKKWEEYHPDIDKRIFYTLKFYMEAHISAKERRCDA